MLPARFTQTILDLYDEEGRQWIANLPSLIARYEAKWDLRVGQIYDLSYNFVARAVLRHGGHAVFKASVPNHELLTEIEALRVYDGRGSARLIRADPSGGAFLVECLEPGGSLAVLDNDDTATQIAAQVMGKLWRPAPAGSVFPAVEEWASGLNQLRQFYSGGTGELPTRLVEMAEWHFANLLPSQTGRGLLHGDLHHGNILAAQRAPWLAIDPKGVLGEAEYETGAILRNQLKPPLKPLLDRRLALLSETLQFDRQRLIGWGLAQSVLSAWWSIEDHGGGWQPAMAVAEALADL